MSWLRFRLYHGNTMKNRSFAESLRHAVRGLLMGLWFEANLRRQVLLFGLVLLLAWWLTISLIQLALLLLVSAAVVTLELINSSLEALADAMHPDYSSNIQRAKDMAAAAVLVVSVVALVVGLVVFVPPLVERLTSYF